MNTTLDRIKSSITISLGMKNRLKKLKGDLSYEEFIAQLLRDKHEAPPKGSYIEIQRLERKRLVHSTGDLKIVFSFNKYNRSPNFIFGIQIERALKQGEDITLDELPNTDEGRPASGYNLYFALLTDAIRSEVEPLFKHKGRIEDYHAWKREFDRLGLPKKAYDNDVMEPLTEYASGAEYQ
jgi:hypothetical protein